METVKWIAAVVYYGMATATSIALFLTPIFTILWIKNFQHASVKAHALGAFCTVEAVWWYCTVLGISIPTVLTYVGKGGFFLLLILITINAFRP